MESPTWDAVVVLQSCGVTVGEIVLALAYLLAACLAINTAFMIYRDVRKALGYV